MGSFVFKLIWSFQHCPHCPQLHPHAAPPAELSCCAACMFDLVFHWLSSCQGSEHYVLGHRQSHRVLLGVTQLLRLYAALNHSVRRGVGLWFLPALYLTQWDSATHLIAKPDLSMLECEFSDLLLQIVHLQQCQSKEPNCFWRNIFLNSWDTVFFTETSVPRCYCFVFFLL